MTTPDPFPEAARAEAEHRYAPEARLPVMKPTDRMDELPRRCAIDGFAQGAEWARDRLTTQEPSEDDAYAAHLERRRHRLSYVKPGVIRCSCGAPGYWGSAAGQEQHAMWHALRAGRAALAEGGEPR